MNQGEILAAKRKREGLSQTEFGHRVGVNRQTVNGWEKRSSLSPSVLLKVCNAMSWLASDFEVAKIHVVANGDNNQQYINAGRAELEKEVAVLRERIASLEKQLALKDDLIDLLRTNSHNKKK